MSLFYQSESEEEDGAPEVSQQGQALQQEQTSQNKQLPTNSSYEFHASQQGQAVPKKHPPRKSSDNGYLNRPPNKRKKTTEN